MGKRRKPPAQKCVHCLDFSHEMSWDHVFPVSWYPDTTSENEEKWKIPSCVRCNGEYGRLEQDFLERVAMCLEPTDPACSGIVKKVMASLDPALAKTPREHRARLAKRKRILGELMQGSAIPVEATYPGLGERWGRPRREAIAVPLPADYCRRMVEKVARGLFFLEYGRLIEPPFEIQHFAAHPENIPDVVEWVRRFGKEFSRPPGLVVRWALAVEDNTSSLFEITFWGQFQSFATVSVAKATAVAN
jgi:hypothetical protein